MADRGAGPARRGRGRARVGLAVTTDGTLRFAELLRRYRLAAGLSQEALAERAGLSARGISDLERGARALPRAETLGRLAEALALSPAERAALADAARPAPAAAPPPRPAAAPPP